MRVLSLASLVLAANHVTAALIDLNRIFTPLQITLTPLSNSKVKASVTNRGSQGYNLFLTGSFLDDDAPVDKFAVHSPNSLANFMGLLVEVASTNLSETQFLPILVGETVETTIDMAELYDVEVSDRYTIEATGSLPYAEIGSTILTGRSVAFASNIISMNIDGDEAAKVPYAVLKMSQKRTTLSCSSSHDSVIEQALENCAMLARNAASAAQTGRLIQEYFKTTSSSVISTIVQRFNAVANECAAKSSGKSSIACSDQTGLCAKPGYIAVTNPSTNVITLCNVYYTSLSSLTGDCGVQDQANTLVHETTHCSGVFSPNTLDYAYGPAVTDLSSDQALLNADTYRMYAGAVHGNCNS